MKIAEVVVTFPPYHGGMGYVCFHNARYLSRRGQAVTVFTLDHGRLSYEEDPGDFQIIRLKTPLIYGDSGMVPQLFNKLKGFDIIHLHYPFFGGAEYVYLASLFRGTPYYLTYHMDVYANTFLKRAIIGAYEPLLMRRIIQHATLVGAVNVDHLRSSKAAGFIDWNRVVEIPNGVDTDKFSPRGKSRELLQKYRFEGKTVVLFVGNLKPFKGVHLLIDAISRIEDERIVLLIVGGGYAENEYRGLVKDKRLEERIIFAGPQSPDKDLAYFYNLCDFLVLPSTESESFGLVVLEAMASGKPVIVSSLPGPSRLVEKGVDGLIVKVGDVEDLRHKILYLAQNDRRCSEMGDRGREKVLKEYGWDIMGDKLEKAFDSIFHDRGKNGL